MNHFREPITIRPVDHRDDLRPTIADIVEASRRIESHIERTAVCRIDAIDAELGAEVYFKLENRQAGGAFKSRGACNTVFSLGDAEARSGVVTHSSGNHGAALARAAQRRGIPAFVVMPETAKAEKIANVERFGAEIIFCRPTQRDREETAERIQRATGATMVHPYDDERIVAGAATAALELGEAVSHLDLFVAPVGGGGLLAGTARTVESLWPWARCWGAEPIAAGDAWQSLRRGRVVAQRTPYTIADGLRTSLGRLNFEFIRRWVSEIVLVGECEIGRATDQLCEWFQAPVEPSSAVVLAALRARRPALRGKRIGVILSGGVASSGTTATNVSASGGAGRPPKE